MSCGYLYKLIKGKIKESQQSDEQEYAYWVQMYNNAKARKMFEKKTEGKNYGEAKFESIYSWLEDVGSDPDYIDVWVGINNRRNFVHLYDYIEFNTLEKPSSKKRLRSVINSDYSYWSLDESKDIDHFSDSETQSAYRLQIRQQAQNFYADPMLNYSIRSSDVSRDYDSFSDSDTHSEYCFQLRQQAHNFYLVM